MRVCVVYDCLFPHTVGGAERWYRNLAERLAAEGHQVTYITLRQWRHGEDARVRGVDVRAVGPKMGLYVPAGRRRLLPPLVFGVGVLWHLLRHGRRYDVVHTASFPYFSFLAAAVARLRWRYRLVVDWHEVWSRAYWREYLGRLRGDIGWLVQLACVRLPQRAYCFSRLYADRLREEGLRGNVTVLPGEYEGPLEVLARRAAEPLVVFAGRHIPEKQVLAIPPAIARARERLPHLRAAILGDGPERGELVRLVGNLGLENVIDVPGFVPTEVVEDLLTRAMCVLLPSRREGYGMIVIEAAARGTPSIVVDAPDNAAVELLTDGENGLVASSASEEDLAAAIVRVHEAGPALRDATAAWFVRNAGARSLSASLAVTLDAYKPRADAGANGDASTEPRRTGSGLMPTSAGPTREQPVAAGAIASTRRTSLSLPPGT